MRDDNVDVTGEREPARDRASELLRLYDEALPKVYGYLLSRCGHVATAEELTSETWLAAAGAPSGTPLGVAFVIGIARHKLVDHWRREARERRNLRAVEAETAANSSDDPWTAEIDLLRARETLMDLSPNHRAVLTLRYVDDLPVSQVAGLMGRSEHGTESLITRAKDAFRRAYGEDDGDA